MMQLSHIRRNLLPWLLVASCVSTSMACVEADAPVALGDELGVDAPALDEDGKPVLGTTGWQEPAGKQDAVSGRPGLSASVDSSETAVWDVKNQWADADTAEARKAGIAWAANSGLTWEEKYQAWVNSLPRVSRGGYGETFTLRTPYGFDLPAPSLECAEVAMFLRITFASWYNLPFFIEATDGKGQRLYFGHFGIRTQNGSYGRMPAFRTQYRDHSAKAEEIRAGRAAWPSDANLAGRRIPGAQDDAQPMIGPNANAGAYFDKIFLNKRVGYFLLLQLTYFGSVNLADSVNTFHVAPEALRPGDTLLHRWQRQGIGHAMVVMRAKPLASREINGVATTQLEAEIASGSMPRRQPLWESPASSKRNFTASYAGGPDHVDFNGGVKRWRTPTKVNGRWTNVVLPKFADHFVNSSDKATLGARPGRLEVVLNELSPQEKLQALVEGVDNARAHLRNYPASCSARQRREAAFEEMYTLGSTLRMTRAQIDRSYRKLEDYVYAPLVYEQSKTCCWNSSTNAMHQLIMEFNEKYVNDTAQGVCREPLVFMGRQDGGDGFQAFRDYARSVGKENLWVAWRADETCPQAAVAQDTPAPTQWTPWCQVQASASTGGGTSSGGSTSNGTTFTSTTPVAIPDNTPAGVTSTITVDSARTIRSVSLDLSISHSYTADLTVELIRGTTKSVIWDGSQQQNGTNIEISGQVLQGFAGQTARGPWQLRIVDAAEADAGTLERWALNFSFQ